MTTPWGLRVEQGVLEARAALPEKEADAAWASADRLTADAVMADVRQRFGSPTERGRRAATGLSRRELEVAELVAAGMTSPAIAEKLFLAERTVETHLNHIMTKLGFNSRAQVAAWVAQHRRPPASGG